MEKSVIFAIASLAISIAGIGAVLFLSLDIQSALKDTNDQLGVMTSRLDKLESAVENMGLVAHWKLEEAGDEAANDSSENGNAGSLNGPSWFGGHRCAVGKGCLRFDGIDDYVRGPEESMRIAYQWTTFGWIRLESHESFNIVVTKMGSSNGHVNYEMKIDDEGRLVCRNHNALGDNIQSISVQSLSNDKWYSIACVFDGTRLRGWIDGNYDGAISMTGNLCTHCVIGTPGPFTVAHAGMNSGCPDCVSEYFHGVIDDIRVYSRALTDSEMDKLYSQKQI